MKLFLLQQRGRLKEEEFVKKLQEMLQEEERQRIPVAQGLPWTTDEPEVCFCYTIKPCLGSLQCLGVKSVIGD